MITQKQKESIAMALVLLVLAMSTVAILTLKKNVEKQEQESQLENSELKPPDEDVIDNKYSTINYDIEQRMLEDVELAQEERKMIRELEERERRQIALEEEREKRRAEKAKQKKTEIVSRDSGYQSNYEITHYTAFCPTGCVGITASGYSVADTIHYQGYRIVAAPPHIDFYTKLRISYSDGTVIDAIVLDRGGDIQGKRLDLLVSDRDEAYRLGRQQVKVKIIH